MKNHDITAAWERWQIAKRQLEESTKDFKRTLAVMGAWVEDGGVQFMDPDKAWTIVVEKVSQKTIHDESHGRPDAATKGLFAWAKERRQSFVAIRDFTTKWKQTFKEVCERNNQNPEEVEQELLREWEDRT